jgi:hypothetical protein
MKINSVLILLFFAASFASAQVEKHTWLPLLTNDGAKIWYDVSEFDTTAADKLDLWILEAHKPPLAIENIAGEIHHSKTLYSIELENVKYGILRVVYYNADNKEIFRHDYNNPDIAEQIRYSYPVTEESKIYSVMKKVLKDEKETE